MAEECSEPATKKPRVTKNGKKKKRPYKNLLCVRFGKILANDSQVSPQTIKRLIHLKATKSINIGS